MPVPLDVSSSPTGGRTASVAGAGVIRMRMHTRPKTADQQVQQQQYAHDSELSAFSKVNDTQRKLALRVVELLLEAK